MVSSAEDPVRARRAAIKRWVGIGQRIGYSSLLLAVVAFVVGALLEFPAWSVTLVVAALVAACVVLPVPIVLGYGVRAAEREDRARE